MADQGEICPICGEGHLEVRVDKNPVEYKGRSALLDVCYSVCDRCGSEQANAAQTRNNKRAMLAFKKQVDGLLTGSEIKALRERLGISQAQAAAIFGGGPVAFSKYENDDVAQSDAMDRLLRLAADLPGAFEELARRAGIEVAPAKPRPGSSGYSRCELKPESDRATGKPHLELVHSSPLQPPAKYAA